MSELIVAGRYARALYDGSVADGALDSVDSDVAMVRASLEGSAELGRFFESPVIARETKLRTTQALFEGRVCDTMLRFLRLLVSKRREKILADVMTAYRRLRDEQLGIVEARATVAREASEDDRESLAASLSTHFEKDVRLTVDVDDKLLGGALIRVDDTVYDGSLRNRLDNLRERFRHRSRTSRRS